MKTRIHPISLILLLAAALEVSANPSSQPITAPPGTRDEIEKSFQARPGGVFKFDADLADAEFVTGDSDTIQVAFIREFKVATAQETKALREKLSVEMTQHDDTNTGENTMKVAVRFTDDRHGTDRQKVRLNFRITIPRQFNLDLRTVGSATVGDLDGWMRARTMGGSLKVGNVSGAVTARSEGGSVTVGNVGGDLEVRSEGGSATLGRVNGRIVATAEGGSVSIEEARTSIEARAAGGFVKAYLSQQPQGDSKIVAEAGNIDFRLNVSAAVNLDAVCSAGTLRSDFGQNEQPGDDSDRLKTALNGGAPLVMLRASAGNIRLHK